MSDLGSGCILRGDCQHVDFRVASFVGFLFRTCWSLDLPTCFVLFPIIVASIARVPSLAHKFFRFSLFPSLETRAVTRQRRKAKLLSNFLALIIMRKGVVKICPKIRMSRNRARRKVSDDGLLLMALRLRLEECKYV